MNRQLGSIDIDCDAPPYVIVQACERLGFQTPLDVRWCRMSRFPEAPEERPSLFSLRAWKQLLGLVVPRSVACRCGRRVSRLRKFRFVLAPRTKLTYLFGQCAGCATVHWDNG
jgi:hypothetical protein